MGRLDPIHLPWLESAHVFHSRSSRSIWPHLPWWGSSCQIVPGLGFHACVLLSPGLVRPRQRVTTCSCNFGRVWLLAWEALRLSRLPFLAAWIPLLCCSMPMSCASAKGDGFLL